MPTDSSFVRYISPYALNDDAKALIKKGSKHFSAAVEEKILTLLNHSESVERMSRYQLSISRRDLGDLYASKGFLQSALLQYEHALELNPHIPVKRKIKSIKAIPEDERKASMPPSTSANLLSYPEYRELAARSRCISCLEVKENLPFPYVCYPISGGIFIGFRLEEWDKIYLCECERLAFFRYINQRKSKSALNRPLIHDRDFPVGFSGQYRSFICGEPERLLRHVLFWPNLCHRCNGKVPSVSYGNFAGSSSFQQQYGWYIEMQRLVWSSNTFPDWSNEEPPPSEIGLIDEEMSALPSRESLLEKGDCDALREYDRRISILARKRHNIIEDKVRSDFQYSKVGESWVSETKLFHIVKGLLPGLDVIMHHRPAFLHGLELDIYIPECKIGIEYQGVQHFKPVSHWGGDEGLKAVQKRDKRKAALCAENGVTLLYVNYDEMFTEESVKKMLSCYIKEVGKGD